MITRLITACTTACTILAGGMQPLHAQPYDTAPERLRVMSWNVEWLFDDYTGDNQSQLAKEQSAPTRQYWQQRLENVASVIAQSAPHIVGLQEIEGDQTLSDLAQQLRQTHDLNYRTAFIQGSDRFTEQDVGLLYQNGLISMRRNEQSKPMYDSQRYYNLSKHLIAEFCWEGFASPLTVMIVHLRATAEAEEPRMRQARLARHWLEPALERGEDVMLLGDFNSEHSAGTLTGDVAAIVAAESESPMVDLLTRLDDARQATHLIRDKQYDRIYVSQSLVEDGPGRDWVFDSLRIVRQPIIRGQKDGSEHWSKRLELPGDQLDVSDHFPVVVDFLAQ